MFPSNTVYNKCVHSIRVNMKKDKTWQNKNKINMYIIKIDVTVIIICKPVKVAKSD